MKVANDAVVTLEYEIKTAKGDVIESSKARGAPLTFIYGKGGLLPGLDKRLAGLESGTEKDFELPPEDAFGKADSGVETTVKRSEFPKGDLKSGSRFEAKMPGGQPVHIVIGEVTEDTVKVRYVHPLAGQSLKVKVKILEVREAKKEELEKGQPG